MAMTAEQSTIIQQAHNLLATDYNGAIDLYNQALKIEATNSDVYIEYAVGAFSLGRYDTAMLALTIASEIGVSVPERIQEVSKQYAASQSHLHAYLNNKARGSHGMSLEKDRAGIIQMWRNSGLNHPESGESSIFPQPTLKKKRKRTWLSRAFRSIFGSHKNENRSYNFGSRTHELDRNWPKRRV